MQKWDTPLTVQKLSGELAPQLKKLIDMKTKPPGSLGRLEEIALRIGLIQNTLRPIINKPTFFVFAGDHGAAREGVSAYPPQVTAQMVLNFLSGGAAINVFTRQHNIDLHVVDAGVDYEFPPESDLIDRKIGRSTKNYLQEPAMSEEECRKAMQAGAVLIRDRAKEGTNLVGFGEMGIGNTSSASLLLSVLGDIPLEECVGPGTGLDPEGLRKKRSLLQQARERHSTLDSSDPFQVLRTFGGFEVAMMTGAMLAAAENSQILLVDGFIATSALLVASRMEPSVLDYCIFAHRSQEPAHRLMLQLLQANPLLDLDLRLGEGTGAALAYPLVESAVRFLNEMASFEEAGVSRKERE